MIKYIIRKWVNGETNPSEPIKVMNESNEFGKEEAFEEFRDMANDLLRDGYAITYISHHWNYTFKKGDEEFDFYMYQTH